MTVYYSKILPQIDSLKTKIDDEKLHNGQLFTWHPDLQTGKIRTASHDVPDKINDSQSALSGMFNVTA
ncbi:hypothetical protein [Nitrosomonas sp. Nm51]|uniref:hypothetical protein n=1 Tax=Nitrosomonas sp. Nm51 TaxID=133720 RepID=UPI00115F91F9|nr:hypothetical protein [Nitrosomonas sp. Nm51]